MHRTNPDAGPADAMSGDAAFAERLGRCFADEGVPRTAGRLLGVLLLHAGELSLDDIAARLQVSRASVSTNARLLERWGVLERTSRPGDRRDFYRVSPAAAENLLERRVERIRRVQALLEEGARLAREREEPVRCRFRALREHYARAVTALQEIVRRGAPDPTRPR